MKILICPPGLFKVNLNTKIYEIVGMSSKAERGYIAVSETDAKELLNHKGYELVNISNHAGFPSNLPIGLKELVEKYSESLSPEEPLQETQVESKDKADESTSTKELIINPCIWCRFKYWIQNKFRRTNKT